MAKTESFNIRTGSMTEFQDITQSVKTIVNESGVSDGLCVVYIPHTTCGITINEAADPDVHRDMVKALNKLIPLHDGYAHAEGNSAAHIKTSLMGTSVSIPIQKSRLTLGTWQGIYACEFDGPRTRNVLVKILQG